MADAVTDVTDGIERIRTITTAVCDGEDYLMARRPQVRQKLAAICAEMQKLVTAVAAASANLTHFRFTVGGSGPAGSECPAVSATPLRLSEVCRKGSIIEDCGAKKTR